MNSQEKNRYRVNNDASSLVLDLDKRNCQEKRVEKMKKKKFRKENIWESLSNGG